MVRPAEGSPEWLAETNDPYLDQRVSIVFIVIDTLFLAIFYISRYYNPKAIGRAMLWCNTLCYICCLGSATTGILMTQIGGVGHHVKSVPITTFQTWLQLSKVLEFTYTPAVMFAKLAALFLYHQVFQVSSYRYMIYVIGVVVILQFIVAYVLAFSICRPFRYFWTQAVDVHDGTCGDVMLFYKSYSIPSLVTDLAMLILPWPILIRLQMPVSDKIGLILTFLAASIFSSFFIFPSLRSTWAGGLPLGRWNIRVFFTTPLFSDPTWYASGGPMIYALVEPSIYMIASILPTTRHLFRRARRVVTEKVASSRGTKSTGSSSTELGGSKNSKGVNGSKDSKERKGIITRHVDIWQGNAPSSQEELTLGQWYQSREGWHRPTTVEGRGEGDGDVEMDVKPGDLESGRT